MFRCLPFVVAVSVSAFAAAVEVAPLKHAHSHNDYLHDRPLLDALDHGFNSVEADIFLVDGKLLVAHVRGDVKPERTLEALYLDPLKKRIDENGGSVFKNGPQFTLLIDIKSKPEPTFAALQKVLANYANMLTTVENGKVRAGAITIIISGERPELDVNGKDARYVGLDGRPSDLASATPAHFMPMISDSWSNQFKWKGNGEMPAEEKAKLKKMVDQAHAAGRVLRFWATPEKESVWRELQAANVDLINTDQLERLEAYLRKTGANQ
jgi:hypothetical protein